MELHGLRYIDDRRSAMHLREDATIELGEEQRTELEKVVRSRRKPPAVAVRARIVLITADGVLLGAVRRHKKLPLATLRTDPLQSRRRSGWKWQSSKLRWSKSAKGA
jgi:hypothetical protein